MPDATTRPSPPKLQRLDIAAATLLFFLSGAVLVIEILAARLLAPVVGLSLETYTSIIGVVLAGIALGHAVGGVVADRTSWQRSLPPCVVGGGLSAIATVPIVQFFAAAPGEDRIAATIVITFAAFFAPAASLSAATPIITKARLHQLDTAGHVVGWLSAASTAGALVGTFLAGFVIVGTVPTSRALYGLGAITTAVGVAIATTAGTVRRLLAGAMSAALLGAFAINAPVPCRTETEYYCVRVRSSRLDPSARILRLDRLTQGYSDLDDPSQLGFRFQRVIADVVADLRPGEDLDTLHIGGGAFAMPRYLAAVRPGTRSRVLEIDPRLDDIARDRLGLAATDADVRNGDGRVLLRGEDENSYDLVINDVLGSLDPPWHLTTAETARDARRLLRPGGIYIVNAVDAGELRFARAEAATLREVFEHVVAVVPPSDVTEVPSNTVLVASDVRRSFPGSDSGRVLAGTEFDAFVGGAEVLTDDFAPVEHLVARER